MGQKEKVKEKAFHPDAEAEDPLLFRATAVVFLGSWLLAFCVSGRALLCPFFLCQAPFLVRASSCCGDVMCGCVAVVWDLGMFCFCFV